MPRPELITLCKIRLTESYSRPCNLSAPTKVCRTALSRKTCAKVCCARSLLGQDLQHVDRLANIDQDLTEGIFAPSVKPNLLGPICLAEIQLSPHESSPLTTGVTAHVRSVFRKVQVLVRWFCLHPRLLSFWASEGIFGNQRCLTMVIRWHTISLSLSTVPDPF